MRPAVALALAFLLAGSLEAGTMRMLVADLPYARVWTATTAALGEYTVTRAADGVIETAWTERSPRAGEAGFERVRERVVVQVEPFAERITRITVQVEASGWRDGQWVPIPDTQAQERAILDRIRDLQG